MKSTTLVLVIVLVHICTVGHGQITLKEKNAPVERVLSAIERQTRYVFLYDPDDLKVGPISIDVRNATLQETLKKCFRGMPIAWVVVGKNVLLIKIKLRILTFKFYDHADPGRTNLA
ncbi:MAG: STN domain-containing protein [Bacteroidetes bacterium]|nr:STN domain-containing protein [Bacteroidota bacterium]